MNKFQKGDRVTRGFETVVVTGSDHYRYFMRFSDGSDAAIEKDWVEDNYSFVVEETTENNAVSPNVYKFPKCEVRDISAHLTSFGGQAVQYVARATRLDGLVKGNPLQDIDKAIQVLQWERERLQEAK